MSKPIHGAPRPRNVPADMQANSPIPCDFKVGDPVIFTNDNGAEFSLTVRGFVSDPRQHGQGRFIYVFTDAWWFPVAAETLRHDPTRPRPQHGPTGLDIETPVEGPEGEATVNALGL